MQNIGPKKTYCEKESVNKSRFSPEKIVQFAMVKKLNNVKLKKVVFEEKTIIARV